MIIVFPRVCAWQMDKTSFHTGLDLYLQNIEHAIMQRMFLVRSVLLFVLFCSTCNLRVCCVDVLAAALS